MAPEVFHLFPQLPLELRIQIYLLATPPRIVHVKEAAQDVSEFDRQFRTNVQLQLSPDLAYFAANWRRRIPGPTTQTTLEDFGITGTRDPPRPWEPSPATPEIPLPWLGEHPEIAWELLREGYLYSNAPIPALLHTCSESRNELIRQGYQLAFRTRTQGPRTWFNFKCDVLYVERVRCRSVNHQDLLSGGQWDVLGQFHSADLKRVKKLALGKSGELLFPWIRYTQQLAGLANTLRLFPAIEELLAVEWEPSNLCHWHYGVSGAALCPHHSANASEGNPNELHCLPVEEIDGLLSLLSYNSDELTRSYDLAEAGFMGEMLKLYKKDDDGTSETALTYMEHRQLETEQRLREYNRRYATSSPSSSSSSDDDAEPEPEPSPSPPRSPSYLPAPTWPIPKIKAVHIFPPSGVSYIRRERRAAFDKLQTMKHEYLEKLLDIATDNSHTFNPGAIWDIMEDDEEPIDLLAPFITEELDDEQFHDVHLGPFTDIDLYSLAVDVYHRHASRWWSMHGSIPEPVSEILY